ncbi:DUF6754 domain-containing protein [Roseiflexus castenholzii]|uniref:DUF6754 domain-containing protein n=1 Tax=Roseiflexus castenholzii (strain DSM 13941 / HLO8) TaxID=383372 RepID=A7NLC1_ROSCS|nr:DUF6754 domain-containing protein [Roseiflexus castenholzii]ABU58304.1 conserved hypothetical protein [Roseiflexus castenholzii DSM 13941]
MDLPLQTLALLLIVFIVIILTLLYHARALDRRRTFSRRPLPALEALRRGLGSGAETGRALHLSPGSGVIGARATTAETIAGLLAAERTATEAALSGIPVIASSGDAVAHLALRGTLRQAYQRAGLGQDYDAGNVQLLAQQDPMAYASGVVTLYGRQRLEASQLIGSFGYEVLLATEAGAQSGIPQVAGATTSTALPLIYLTADGTLIGEEIYAAEAYLSRAPEAHGRLLTHDALRTVTIVAIVALALWQSLIGL